MKLTRIVALGTLACGGGPGSVAESPADPTAQAAIAHAELVTTVDRVPRLLGPGWISTGDDDAHAVFAPDGGTLYFLKDTPGFDLWTIVSTTRGARGWSRPDVVSFSGQYPDGDLVFTPDGRRAYFVSMRPVAGVARRDTEIWTVARHPDGSFGAPEHVVELSSPADEWFPTIASDGTMYFGSCREGGLGGCDIWRAAWRGDHFAPPENLGAPINSAAQEIEPLIDPDQRFLVISIKDRPDSLGSYDLYLARRNADGSWQAPQHLPAPINSHNWDFGPRLSPDGRWFLFTSNRGFASEPLPRALRYDELEHRLHGPGNGLRDIYVVDARVLATGAPR
jgi:Tol biopolymer transport system component